MIKYFPQIYIFTKCLGRENSEHGEADLSGERAQASGQRRVCGMEHSVFGCALLQ